MEEDEVKGEIMKKKIELALNCNSKEFSKAYREYKEAEARFNKLYEPFKEKLLEVYDTDSEMAKIIIIDDLKITHVSASTRTSVDTKKLKEEEPEIAKKYTKTTNVKATLKLEDLIMASAPRLD